MLHRDRERDVEEDVDGFYQTAREGEKKGGQSTCVGRRCASTTAPADKEDSQEEQEKVAGR